VLLEDVVADYLDFRGFSAVFVDDPDQAKGDLARLMATRQYPVLLTPLNTTGEKPYEEFSAAGETVEATKFAALHAVPYLEPAIPGSFASLVSWLDSTLSSGEPIQVDTDEIQQRISAVEAAFAVSHRASSLSLDSRM